MELNYRIYIYTVDSKAFSSQQQELSFLALAADCS